MMRLMGGLLFDLSPTDPLTLGAVTVLLLVVSGLASALPAIRALRVSPMAALRHE